MASVYRTDGISIVIGTGERRAWRGLSIESREDCYSVRAYEGDLGHVEFSHNCHRVPSLPNTPLTRQLLATWQRVKAMMDDGADWLTASASVNLSWTCPA